MNVPDRERGEMLLAAIKAELSPDTPEAKKVGWAYEDVHDLFDCWGFEKLFLWDGYYLRYKKEHFDLAMQIPPIDPLAGSILAQVVELVEELKRRLEIFTQEEL